MIFKNVDSRTMYRKLGRCAMEVECRMFSSEAVKIKFLLMVLGKECLLSIESHYII